ncbi:MAG: hypothetical protein SVR81_01440 [Chloroflexota bacterium]|nr:hypothetical protein [Chloroflexota bacterium]
MPAPAVTGALLVLVSIGLEIGAVVYYLKVITRQVKGFDVEKFHVQLVATHNIIERQGAFLATAQRFLILAQKGA